MSQVMGVYLPTAGKPLVAATRSRPSARRVLQLALAVTWLLDGVLQLQGFFFTKAFGSQMIAMTAAGNPWFIARPIKWSGAMIGEHAVLADSVFALVQIAIGLGIAWRPTLRVALAASIAWSFGVWWIGEGFGGIFNGTANPITGAPGAVIIYALLAVLLWPRKGADLDHCFPGATAIGRPGARALWLLLWGSLSYLAVAGVNSSAQGVHDLIGSMASSEPRWVASLDRYVARLVAHQGTAVSVSLAILLGMVALGVLLPRLPGNFAVGLAALIALLFWVVGQNFGGLFTNSATDVNSGPLLILLAAAFWRPRRPGQHALNALAPEAVGSPT